jgi:hypothetical protein
MAGLMAVVVSAFSLGLGLVRDPYVGVACSGPNSTTCGRVGIAVWVARRHAIRVDATLSGVHVRLAPPKMVGSYWVGFVHLPLRSMGLPASWAGAPAKQLTLQLRIRYPSGWRTGTLRLDLHSGWG